MTFLKGLLFDLAGKYIQALLDLIKAEILIAVVRALGGLRRLLWVLSLWVFLLIVMAAGLIMIPITLCSYMPWSNDTKLIVMLVFAALFILVPLLAFIMILSERRWLRMFKVEELVNRLVEKKD